MESLILSTTEELTSLDMAYSGVFHDAGVVALNVVAKDRINKSPTYQLLSAAYDGVVCLSDVLWNGTLRKIHVVNTNRQVKSLSSRYFFSENCIECFMVSEDSFAKAAISVSTIRDGVGSTVAGIIPFADTDISKPQLLSELETSQSQVELPEFGSLASIVRTHTAPTPTADSPDILRRTSLTEELQRELGLSSTGSEVIGDYAQNRRLSYSNSALLRPMTPHERIHTTDFEVLRKDQRLLNLFRQEDSLSQGFVTAQSVFVIVDRWLDGVKIAPESMRELLSIFGISHEEERLDIVQVCRLIAVVASTLKDQGVDVQAQRMAGKKKPSKTYKQMNLTKKSISYNAMGERVVRIKSMSDILGGNVVKINVDGSCDSLRRRWGKQPPRVDDHISHRICKHTLLKRIPSQFADLIQTRNIEFPREWNPRDEHWIGQRRAVRIARTICDMRYAAQQEAVLSTKQGVFNSRATSMSKLLLKYFERNFGAASLHIAHHKVVHFLEVNLAFLFSSFSSSFSILCSAFLFVYSIHIFVFIPVHCNVPSLT